MARHLAFLVGASGVGKTAVVEFLAASGTFPGRTFHFDDIGVPSEEEMIRDFGGGEEWQRWATERWVAELAARDSPFQVLEGQTRPSFIKRALATHPEVRSRIILLDCRADVRGLRLSGLRQRPELANPRMERWAAYLRGQADALGLPVVDTSDLSVEAVAQKVSDLLELGSFT